MRITEVRFGEPQRNAKIRPPHYPEDAVHARLGAKVLLAIRLDATGQVLDAQAFQTSLDALARSEGEAERWRRVFERASLAAAKDWRYDMSETVNGKPIGTNAIVPVVFALHELGTPVPPADKWKAYVPGLSIRPPG
jgi:outer membrane biosynthesis protein TonB